MSLTFADKDIESIGVGSFGPIDPVKGADLWSHYNDTEAALEQLQYCQSFGRAF